MQFQYQVPSAHCAWLTRPIASSRHHVFGFTRGLRRPDNTARRKVYSNELRWPFLFVWLCSFVGRGREILLRRAEVWKSLSREFPVVIFSYLFTYFWRRATRLSPPRGDRWEPLDSFCYLESKEESHGCCAWFAMIPLVHDRQSFLQHGALAMQTNRCDREALPQNRHAPPLPPLSESDVPRFNKYMQYYLVFFILFPPSLIESRGGQNTAEDICLRSTSPSHS